MDVESFLEGDEHHFGRYQASLLVLLSFSIVIGSWQCYLHAFLGFIPPHRCWIEGVDNDATRYNEVWVNESVPGIISTAGQWIPDGCSLFSEIEANNTSVFNARPTHKCHRWKHDNEIFESVIATEWQLFCDKEWWISIAGSVNMAGGCVGFFFMGLTADRFGRKAVLLFCLCLVALCGTGAAFSNNIYIFMVFRFFVELGESSLHYVLYVLAIELTGIQWRVKVTVVVCIIYSVGVLSLSGIVQILNNWKVLQLATSAPAAVLVAVYVWFLPESPRWLLTQNRAEEANNVINKIKSWNKIIINNNNSTKDHVIPLSTYGSLKKEGISIGGELISPTKLLTLKWSADQQSLDQQSLLGKLQKLFNTRILATRVLAVALIRFFNGLVFVGLTLNSTDLDENGSVLTFFLSGAVEIPAYLLCLATLDTFGRRMSVVFAFFFTALFCFAIILVSTTLSDQWLLLTLLSITKFCSTFVSGVMFVFMAELFPTEVRGTGVGVASFASSLSFVVAPLFTLAESSVVPCFVYGISSLIGGFLSFYLPETRNMKLFDTIEEAEEATTQANKPVKRIF